MHEIGNKLFVSHEDVNQYSQRKVKPDAALMLALVLNPLTENTGAEAFRFPLPDNTNQLVFGESALPKVGNWYDGKDAITLDKQLMPIFEKGITVVFESMKNPEGETLKPLTLLTGDGRIFFNTSTIDEFFMQNKFTPLSDDFITGLSTLYRRSFNPVAKAVKTTYPLI